MSKKKNKSRKVKPLKAEVVPADDYLSVAMRYEAARKNDENKEQWIGVDSFSADASANPLDRKNIREYARNEVSNNSYAKGVVLTIANVTVGSGPRLQITENVVDETINQEIEQSFASWAKEIDLSAKLRTMRSAKVVDGEAFGILMKNGRLSHESKLDLKLIECDRVYTPFENYATADLNVDGIEIDDLGDPVFYYVSNRHPGDLFYEDWGYKKIKAESVVHWFRKDRPEQHRGVSELAPSIKLFYLLRRYTNATLDAAEMASNFPMVLESNMDAYNAARFNGSEEKNAFTKFKLEKGTVTCLPRDHRLSQVRAEQPTVNYSNFVRQLLTEIGRCLEIPVNILMGDSSKHNYASGRLDFQTFVRALNVERETCERNVIDRIFKSWYYSTYVHRKEPSEIPFLRVPKHYWFWDGFEHVDPVKEANAQAIRLLSGVTTFSDELKKDGKDYYDVFRQRKKERDLLVELGLVDSNAEGLKEASIARKKR